MKEIHEQRVRRYFIDSAKNILKSEGNAALTARTVSEAAGYSFATLYNYFKDMKELIKICVGEFITECQEYILNGSKEMAPGQERLKTRAKLYLNYFVQYTGIYDAVFLEKLSEYRYNQEIQENLTQLFESAFGGDILKIQTEKQFSDEKIIKIKELLWLTLNAQLLLYVNRNYPKDYREFISSSEGLLDYILS